MKKQAYTLIAMAILLGSMAVAAQAQTSGRNQFTANIPFEFSVGNRTLPAGDYTVRQINPASDNAVLQIRSMDGDASAMVQTNSVIGKAPERAMLIFRRYGEQYFFAEAWVDGDNTGLKAPKSRSERNTTRELAGISPKTETVALSSQYRERFYERAVKKKVPSEPAAGG